MYSVTRESRVDALVYPALIAHRGGCPSHPDNSLQAFRQAISLGADLIEIDVRLTADGKLVVVHDPYVEFPDGRIALVSELTSEQVRREGFAQGTTTAIPTLQEVLNLVQGRVGLEIEIKQLRGEPGPPNLGLAAAEELTRLLVESSFKAALVTCFEARTLDRVRECAPQIATGLETEGPDDLASGLEHCLGGGYEFVLPDVTSLLDAGPTFVEEAHRLGVRVAPWIVDETAVLAHLFATGVDAIETDNLVVAIPIRDHSRSLRRPAGPVEPSSAPPG